MNAPTSINELNHNEIRFWLERALHGRETLPRLTPDESPHLGILRLEKTLKQPARDSLRDGCVQLVRQFCRDGRGETGYVLELLGLAAAFRSPETIQMLAQLARRFPQVPGISLDVRFAVLAALVDTPPPQPPGFWESILTQSPQDYGAMALSGVLATHPAQAIQMLPAMPDTERAGQAAALKIELAWDDLPPKKRFQFVQDIQEILPQCGSRFVGPVKTWTDSKQEPGKSAANPTLGAALSKELGAEVYYKRALEAEPKDANSLGNYGQLLVGRGRLSEGEEALLAALRHVHPSCTALLAEFSFSLWLVSRMQHRDADRWERGFKFLIQQGFKRPRWSFDRMLEQAEGVLPPDEFEYAKALGLAFLDESNVAALERYERWRALEALDPLAAGQPT